MRLFLRVSLVVLAGSAGCVGGPVSDWPAKNNDRGGDSDGEDDTVKNPNVPPSGNSSMDAGLSAPAEGGDPSTRGDGGAPCSADASNCRASCAGDAGGLAVDPAARTLRGCDGDAPDATD